MRRVHKPEGQLGWYIALSHIMLVCPVIIFVSLPGCHKKQFLQQIKEFLLWIKVHVH